MRRIVANAFLPCLFAAAAGTACAAAQATADRVDVAITGVSVVDVERGEIAGPRTVLVADNLIVAVVADDAGPWTATARHIDGRGRYLIPGLVDMHVHLFNHASGRAPNDWAFALFVANGVTAVREMAASTGDMAQVARWNESVAKGELVAPRIVAAAVPFRGTDPDDAPRQLAAAQLAGADFVKVFSDVTNTSWVAIQRAANDLGLPIVGHVPAATSLLSAARGGLASNEHLTQAHEACTAMEDKLLAQRRTLDAAALGALRDAQEAQVFAAFDPRICDDVAAELALTGQVQVPTLALPNAETRLDASRLESDRRHCLLRADEWQRWQRIVASLPPQAPALAQARWTVTQAITRAFHRAGVEMLAGTDAPMPGVYPGYSLQDEIGLLVDAGLTPHQALRAATLAPASFLGIARESGTIEPGKRADLVLLDDNPLLDIDNTRRIRAVLIGGRVLDRSDLDAMLQAAAVGCGPPGATH